MVRLRCYIRKLGEITLYVSSSLSRHINLSIKFKKHQRLVKIFFQTLCFVLYRTSLNNFKRLPTMKY